MAHINFDATTVLIGINFIKIKEGIIFYVSKNMGCYLFRYESVFEKFSAGA